ncbi:MAG: GspE/PulE family protein [Candidatus Aceula meridiana]|nr:GspE/PulE family protein [Candidatus Aceula meridiana]
MSRLEERYQAILAELPEAKKSRWNLGASETKDEHSHLSSNVVNLILEEAVLEHASDIHIEPSNKYLKVRYRIDGLLEDVLHLEEGSFLNILGRIKIMAGMEPDAMAKRKSQDGRFSAQFGVSSYDFRLSTFPTVSGEKMAIRILEGNASIYQLSRLGVDPYDLKNLEKALNLKSGLMLICGPTGSGKTTTLYALINHLNTPENNIVTLEDPVEYRIEGMNQCDIESKSGMGFAEGLRSILRQDPDIILVGEIRDKETADVALRAAITGHMVFSSVHATSAIGTIIRLTNMGLDHFLVSFALSAAISQRLVRQICEHCKTAHHINSEQAQKIKLHYHFDVNLLRPHQDIQQEEVSYVDLKSKAGPQDIILYKGKGCENCRGTGYKNRVAIFEIVFFGQELREAILRKATTGELQKIVIQNGGRTLAMDAIEKVKNGMTTLEEIYPILIESQK